MKKTLSFITLLLLLVFSVTVLTGCSYNDYASKEAENLLKGAVYKDKNGETVKTLKGKAGDFFDINLDTAVTLNTIALSEKGNNIVDFKLYYKNAENEMVFFYQQDLVEDYRYCTFDAITTNLIRIEVLAVNSGDSWKLSFAKGYYITGTAEENFRVMGYCPSGNSYNKDNIDQEQLRAVTHLNLIHSVDFDKNGNIVLHDRTVDGKPIDGTSFFETELNNNREILSGTDTKIIVTILPTNIDGEGLSGEAIHTAAMNSDHFIANINAFIEKYDLDGIAFDYEYPYSYSENQTYGKFVKKLKKAMPEGKLLSLAMSVWQFKLGLFPRSSLDYVDLIEMMAYDQFTDDYGYHSTFQNGLTSIMDDIVAYNLTKHLSKIDIGLPFYSRPTDEFDYWGNYFSDYELLGKFKNILDVERSSDGVLLKPLYYNSYQMIFDKTNYCLDNKVGGVMIWHINSDVSYSNPLSLMKAITSAIESRS